MSLSKSEPQNSISQLSILTSMLMKKHAAVEHQDETVVWMSCKLFIYSFIYLKHLISISESGRHVKQKWVTNPLDYNRLDKQLLLID